MHGEVIKIDINQKNQTNTKETLCKYFKGDKDESASHLDELEAEAIYIIREVAAECEKPVMLYSIGKDSSVMLHLAMKAFYPENRRSRSCTLTQHGSSRI